jgi:hypothetical protein
MTLIERGTYPDGPAAVAAFNRTPGAVELRDNGNGTFAVLGGPLNADGEYEGETPAESATPSLAWTRAELLAHAADLGIEVETDANKAAILAAIEGAG